MTVKDAIPFVIGCLGSPIEKIVATAFNPNNATNI